MSVETKRLILSGLIATAFGLSIGCASSDSNQSESAIQSETAIASFVPESANAKLIFEERFDTDESVKLDDWIMEGPGIAKVEDERLIIYPVVQPKMSALYDEGVLGMNDGQKGDYYKYTQQFLAEERPDVDQSEMVWNEQFKGGHINFWHQFELPENYIIRCKFESLSKQSLHMIMFSALGLEGQNIFDESMAKRNGVAAQLMYGDLRCYRVSYFAPERGTANMRVSPGRQLTIKGRDYASESEGVHDLVIVKWENRVLFYVDDKLSFNFEHTDEFGEVLGGGSWGLRLMNTAKGAYDDFEIFSLTKK
ncbi:DUF1961 family protein [Planctomycetota bacterium]|nr:DUF1961 family protein [Planctomycetota bacterium]